MAYILKNSTVCVHSLHQKSDPSRKHVRKSSTFSNHSQKRVAYRVLGGRRASPTSQGPSTIHPSQPKRVCRDGRGRSRRTAFLPRGKLKLGIQAEYGCSQTLVEFTYILGVPLSTQLANMVDHPNLSQFNPCPRPTDLPRRTSHFSLI